MEGGGGGGTKTTGTKVTRFEGLSSIQNALFVCYLIPTFQPFLGEKSTGSSPLGWDYMSRVEEEEEGEEGEEQ